jgi:hypothetical protein
VEVKDISAGDTRYLMSTELNWPFMIGYPASKY